MIVDRKPGSNRRDVSCEIVGRPSPRPAFGGGDEYFASQAVQTLTAIGVVEQTRSSTARAGASPAAFGGGANAEGIGRDRAGPRHRGLHHGGDNRDRRAGHDRLDCASDSGRLRPLGNAGQSSGPQDRQRPRDRSTQQTEDNQELLITGEIVNLRESETPAPNLRLALRAEDGRELYVWTVRGPKYRLGPQERVAFRARLAAPPAGVRDVLVKFSAAGDKASFTESHS